MRLRTPQGPSERGVHRDRPYWLWVPDGEPPWPAMVILHGAGSAKENHADFARLCAASGWLALTYDQRGHGESKDEMGPQAVEDVGRMAAMLGERDDVRPRRICVRGSSMGGFLAIHAAATSKALAGVIAICPATEEGLRRGLRDGELEMRADADALDAWLAEHDVAEAASLLAGRPLMLLHARGDERVPYTASEEIFARATEPKRLLLLPGGHHRSIQHDAELQAASLRWLQRAIETG
jgi:alpha-beta hydrolase superfamily lysophospholipase